MKTRFKVSSALAAIALGVAGAAYAWTATPQSCRIAADNVGLEIKAMMEADQKARAQQCAALSYPQNIECYNKIPTTQQNDAQRAQIVEMLYGNCLSGAWIPQEKYR